MLSSQALETVIGLVLLFFVISLAASGIVELISQVFSKRAKNLEWAVGQMLHGFGGSPEQVRAGTKRWADEFKGTSVYEAARAGARKGRASYLSATAFAEGVGEMVRKVDGVVKGAEHLPEGLKRRLEGLARQPAKDATAHALAIKSGLEHWFDDTMDRAQGAYKRWTSWVLLVFGLALAILLNASTFRVAEQLWHEPATRQAIVNAAPEVTKGDPQEFESLAKTTAQLDELKLPVGWDDATFHGLHHPMSGTFWAIVGGWIATGFLVTLGAPFWFDLLTRLVALRSSGAKPPTAANDPGSATQLLTSGVPAAAPATGAAAAPPVIGGDGWEGRLEAAFGLTPAPPAN